MIGRIPDGVTGKTIIIREKEEIVYIRKAGKRYFAEIGEWAGSAG